ncbi:zinc finger protein 337 [Aedes albopictus]|uniref:C2H2-type domain-containing protein n=1 Tax=Aedes albopictus TaxID=7160 RepID=A0ABM1ZGQ7_AEDAL|nr:zinc finger protein 337-like [Aedes albopictus]
MSSPSLLHQGQSVAAICRLCFMEQVPTDLEPIFDDDSGYLSEWIEKLTSLKITNVPNAPTSLCSSCKSTLEAFDSFREMCITNDHVFKETFCQDTRRWGELTDGNEEQTDGDQQTEDVVERNLNALSKSGIHAEQEENDVSVIQLLVDVYESDTCDETDGKDRDINQEGNFDEPMEAAFAEDAIQTEYEQMDGNIGSDEHTVQIDVANRTVNSYPMSDCRQYPCKICKSFVSKLHILTHKETYLFECYICSGRVQRYKYMSKHFYRWHREIMIGMPAETDIDNINYQYSNENNCQVQTGNNSVPCTGPENFDFITESAPIAYICKICMQATSKLHAISHKAVGVFLCNVCNKTFDRIGLLTMHAKSHSKNQSSLVCKDASNEIIDLCDDQPEGTPVSTEGDFEAQIVGHTIPIGRGAKKDDSRLKTSEEYGKNLRTVNGERFFCKICNNFVSELHQTTHKGKDLFTCTCLQTFPRFALLSKHVQSHSHRSYE